MDTTFAVNPLTVFFDDQCNRWVDIAPTGMWRFVARRDVELALSEIDKWITVTTFFAGIVQQRQQIRRLSL